MPSSHRAGDRHQPGVRGQRVQHEDHRLPCPPWRCAARAPGAGARENSGHQHAPADGRHRQREGAQDEADGAGAEAALVAQDGHRKGVHVPAHRQQPVHHQQPLQPGGRSRSQVRRPSGAGRTPAGARCGTRRADNSVASGSSQQQAVGGAKARGVDHQPAATGPMTLENEGATPSQLKMRTRSGGLSAARPAGALDGQHAHVGAGAGGHRAQAQQPEVPGPARKGRGHGQQGARARSAPPPGAPAGGSPGGRPGGPTAGPVSTGAAANSASSRPTDQAL
jgi:hypothetical protein